MRGAGGRVSPWQQKICHKSRKIQGKEGKNQEKKLGKKEEKSGRKGKNREGSVTLPLLTEGWLCCLHDIKFNVCILTSSLPLQPHHVAWLISQ